MHGCYSLLSPMEGLVLGFSTFADVFLVVLVLTVVPEARRFLGAGLRFISLLAVACVRFIPAFNNIVSSINTIKFYSPSVEVISKEINNFKIQYA